MYGRRRFCSLTSASVFGLVTGCGAGPAVTGTESPDTESPGTSSGDTSGTSGGSSATTSAGTTGSATTGGTTTGGSTGELACEPSPPDIEGPFYRPNIPVGGELDLHGDAGVPLILSGVVIGTDCAPVEGAVVELWHATPVLPAGAPGDVDAAYDDTELYRYYGQVATDSEGRYSFTTLKPGWYLNGPKYRPAHLHLKLWVGGEARLTTQVYFAGDPFNEGDNWYNPEMEVAPDADGQATLDLTV
jgi:protocatechuate 3,4-dioxygenase beta subunit